MSNMFTVVARHLGQDGKTVVGYTIIDQNYQTRLVSVDDLKREVASKKSIFTNIGLSDGKHELAGTNGSIEKYTTLGPDNSVVGTARAVILNRAEQNGRLIGYTVFSTNGTIMELKVADAVALCNRKLISNGKIRHTETGDIVSAIGGTYPLRQIEVKSAPKGVMTVDIMYFTKAYMESDRGIKAIAGAEYFGAIVSCTSATEMSKATDVLSKSNAALTSGIIKSVGPNIRETIDSLKSVRYGANGIYGVFSIDMIDKLIKAGAVLRNGLGVIPVDTVLYGSDSIVDAANIKLSSTFSIANKKDASGAYARQLNSDVKTFAKEVATKLNGKLKSGKK